MSYISSHSFISNVESTVTGERMAADSVKDLAASRKCVAHLVATNLLRTVSDLHSVTRRIRIRVTLSVIIIQNCA